MAKKRIFFWNFQEQFPRNIQVLKRHTNKTGTEIHEQDKDVCNLGESGLYLPMIVRP